MQDQNPRQYHRVDSIPPSRSSKAVPPGIYNLWPGFRAESLPVVDQEDVLWLVQPILDHLRDVITGPDHLEFLIAWLAQQVQDPAEKTQVAIVLQGKQGAGKNIVFDFWKENVLGFDMSHPKNCTAFQTSDPSEHIFGKHAEAQQNKVFVMIDEISGDDMRPLMSRLKDRITNSTINVNPKCHKEYSVRNMSNFLCTTNNMNPLNIEPEERRFVVFGCNSSKKGDTAYFNELGKHLKRDDVARAFFQYLRDHVDVGRFRPFQSHRPQTEAYEAIQQRTIPLFYKFLSAEIDTALGMVGGNVEQTLLADAFYQRMLTWARDGNYNTTGINRSCFGGQVKKLMDSLKEVNPSQHVLVKKKRPQGFEYRVHWGMLKEHLKETKLYDPNAGM